MPYLNRDQIIELIKNKRVILNTSKYTKQIQPASLDLTISNECYRIKASFFPNNINYSLFPTLFQDFNFIPLTFDKINNNIKPIIDDLLKLSDSYELELIVVRLGLSGGRKEWDNERSFLKS